MVDAAAMPAAGYVVAHLMGSLWARGLPGVLGHLLVGKHYGCPRGGYTKGGGVVFFLF